MKFQEIPDKCSVCGNSLLEKVNFVKSSDSEEYEEATNKMFFYYIKCPKCKEISNILCTQCYNHMASTYKFIWCEYCGEAIRLEYKGIGEGPIFYAALYGHQCDRHKRDIEEAETL